MIGAGAPAPDEAVGEEVLAGGTQEVGGGTAGAWGTPDDGGAVAPQGAVSGQRAVRGAVVTVSAQGAKMGIQSRARTPDLTQPRPAAGFTTTGVPTTPNEPRGPWG